MNYSASISKASPFWIIIAIGLQAVVVGDDLMLNYCSIFPIGSCEGIFRSGVWLLFFLGLLMLGLIIGRIFRNSIFRRFFASIFAAISSYFFTFAGVFIGKFFVSSCKFEQCTVILPMIFGVVFALIGLFWGYWHWVSITSEK